MAGSSENLIPTQCLVSKVLSLNFWGMRWEKMARFSGSNILLREEKCSLNSTLNMADFDHSHFFLSVCHITNSAKALRGNCKETINESRMEVNHVKLPKD